MQRSTTPNPYTSEDLSKPENRVNVALFGLMPQNWFREWFLEKLNLPLDSILYPPVDELGARLDLKVDTPDGSPVARIEVELGTDPEQIHRYRCRYTEPVKAVWGRRGDGGDLSLEEISEFLSECVGSQSPQTQVNIEHLKKLIDDGLRGHSRSRRQPDRVELSDEMKKHPLVVGLKERLRDSLVFTTGKVGLGRLKGDGMKEGYFSLWTLSPFPKRGMFFILNLSEASGKMQFPDKLYLENGTPHRHAIEKYAALLNEIGLNIDNGKNTYHGGGSLHVDVVLPHLEELAQCVRAFVDPN